MMACVFALTGCGTSTSTEAPSQEAVQQAAEKAEEVAQSVAEKVEEAAQSAAEQSGDMAAKIEEYAKKVGEVAESFDNSKLYTPQELTNAAALVLEKFEGFNSTLLSLRYAGDEANNEDNLKWLSDLGGKQYDQVAKFITDFHTSKEGTAALGPDEDYKDYEWYLARVKDGDWELITWGY